MWTKALRGNGVFSVWESLQSLGFRGLELQAFGLSEFRIQGFAVGLGFTGLGFRAFRVLR